MASFRVKLCVGTDCEWGGSRPWATREDDHHYEETNFCGACGTLLHTFQQVVDESKDAWTPEPGGNESNIDEADVDITDWHNPAAKAPSTEADDPLSADAQRVIDEAERAIEETKRAIGNMNIFKDQADRRNQQDATQVDQWGGQGAGQEYRSGWGDANRAHSWGDYSSRASNRANSFSDAQGPPQWARNGPATVLAEPVPSRRYQGSF